MTHKIGNQLVRGEMGVCDKRQNAGSGRRPMGREEKGQSLRERTNMFP